MKGPIVTRRRKGKKGGPLKIKVPRISPTARKILNRFDKAAADFAVIGMYEGQEARDITKEYDTAKLQLTILIHNLEWWIPLGG